VSGLAQALASKALQGLDVAGADEEAEYALRFILLLGVDDANLKKRERPDFVIGFGSKSVALEVTRYHADIAGGGSEEARFFKLWRSFADDLRRSLASAGVDNIYGAIHFRQKSRAAIPERDRLISEITAAVASACRSGALTDIASIESFDPDGQPALYTHVEYIYLRNTAPERGALWWCAHLQAGCVPDPEDGLRDRVNAKDIAAKSYPWPPSDERWLLIYAASRGLSDMARVENAIAPPIQSSEFDRVFLYDAFAQRVHQLHPEFVLIRDGRDLYVRRLPAIVPGALAD